jgi:hypothetical protein
MRDDTIAAILTGPAGIASTDQKRAELTAQVDCEEALDFSNRRRARISCVAPHMLDSHEGSCRCDGCSTGVSHVVWAGIDPDCGCGCADGTVRISVPMDQKNCPAASMPWDVWQAKTNPIYESVWKCFDFQTTANILDQYSTYQLCTLGGEWSVLLAATHFIQLHLRINPNFGLAASKQASLGRSVAPMHPAILHNRGIINSNYGSNHWSFSSHGLEYQTLLKGPVALAGMAWGI